ncbi:MAG TPA: hypothetical protein VF708_02765 [Pyrinomonadaceae bacterium]|jgi:hypothetical protein
MSESDGFRVDDEWLDGDNTGRMIKAAQYAIGVVIIHLLVSALHGASHQRLNVPLSSAQNLFIIVVIFISPLAAALLLWKKQHASGALLLLGSMAGSLAFGVYNHFVASSPDHVSHVAAAASGVWVTVFQVTAALLAVVEAFGCLAGVWILRLCLGASRLTT